jgi:hypothetical protein
LLVIVTGCSVSQPVTDTPVRKNDSVPTPPPPPAMIKPIVKPATASRPPP